MKIEGKRERVMVRKINKICIIAENYPTEKEPIQPFIHELVVAFTELGVECMVLNPVSITNVLVRHRQLKPKHWRKHSTTHNIPVYSPRYLSFSSKKMGFINTNKWNVMGFERSCLKTLKKSGNSFDAVYGHFIFPAGITANLIGEKYNIPAFFAYGENTNYTIDYLGRDMTARKLQNIKGVVAVSSVNKNNLVEQKIIDTTKIGVFPNGVNSQLFYKREKYEMRKKYHLPLDEFIVVFVGRFVEVKGAKRLSKAIKCLDDLNIKSVFVGYGDVEPDCSGILFKGTVPHDEIPELLSAADVFVLPTLAEGCCNSIIEAMACGLPIISSNQPFNDDILDDTCSIRIDSSSIDEIADALRKLYMDKDLRNKLSEGALKKARNFDIQKRAENILLFMESKI